MTKVQKVQMKNGSTIKASLHPGMIVISNNDDPRSWERLINNHQKMMQHEKLMFFQHKLQYDLLAERYKSQLPVFNDEVSIVINIKSKKSLSGFLLERVLKAILDACNKNVIQDDRLVRNVLINFETLKGSKDIDEIQLTIEDDYNNNSLILSTELTIDEKQEGFPYAIGGGAKLPAHSIAYQQEYRNALSQLLRPMQQQVSKLDLDCHMRFDTSNLKQDVDNMMLMYLPIFRDLLTSNQGQVLSLGLYKRDANTSDKLGTSINMLLK